MPFFFFFWLRRYISHIITFQYFVYSGSPPGKKEEPYLTEAGREAFDKFYKLREGEMQLFSSTALQLPQLVLMREPELVKDVLNVLIGVVSTTFSLNQVGKIFNCNSQLLFFLDTSFSIHYLFWDLAVVLRGWVWPNCNNVISVYCNNDLLQEAGNKYLSK